MVGSVNKIVPNVIFDLDGTLVDSAPSLCKAANHLMEKLGRQSVSVEKYQTFIGKGMYKQVEQLLEFTGGVPNDGVEGCLKTFRKYYDKNSLIATKCYPGVGSALKELKKLSLKLAICTQKAEKPAIKILKGLNLFQFFDGFAFGDSLNVLKPDSKMVLHAIRDFPKAPLIYVGDSEIDALTAKNSEATFLLYSQGYRKSSVSEIKPKASFKNYQDLPGLVLKLIGNNE